MVEPSSHSFPHPERRRYKRFLPRECDLSLVQEQTGFLKIFLGRHKQNMARAVVDLSEGGARFVTKGRLAVGTHVRVTINVRLFNDTLNFTGTVCWVSEHQQRGKQYYTGVLFDAISPLQARKISSIRDYLLSPQYRQKEETRRRTRPSYDTSALEYDV